MKSIILVAVLLSLSFSAPAQPRSIRPASNKAAAIRRPAPAGIPAPVQVYPADASVFDHFQRHTVLVWDRVPDAAAYSVEVDCFHCCERGRWCTDIGKTWLIREGLVSNVFDFNFVGAQPGRWRVWSVDAAGQRGEASPWRTFRYRQ